MKTVIFVILLTAFVFGPWSSSLRATMILPPQKEIKLEDLSKRAEVVFKGTCQERRHDFGTNPATKQKIPLEIYSFKVEEVIKGDLREGQVFEVKQVGLKTRQPSASDHHFETGKSYLLFLGGPNPLGVHSVIGDVHGKYLVTKEPEGKEVLKNPFGVPETEAKSSTGKAEKSVFEKKSLSKEEGYREFVEKIEKSLKEKR